MGRRAKEHRALQLAISLLGAVCAPVGAIASPLPAPASDQTSPPLAELRVTARRRATPLFQEPVSANVLPGQYLADHALVTLAQMSQRTPGVFVADNANASKLFVRGIGSQGNAGMDQSVALYLDGLYYGRSRASKQGLHDLAQVAVLQGPQGTYLGLNASAGALVAQSALPQADQRAVGVQLTGRFDDGAGLNGFLNQPLGGAGWSARVAAKIDRFDGPWTMIDPFTGETAGRGGGRQQELLRVTITSADQGQRAIKLLGEWQSIERNNPFAWQPRGCDDLYTLGLQSQAELDAYWAGLESAEDNPLRVPDTCQAEFLDASFDQRSPAAPYNRSGFEHARLSAHYRERLGPLTLRAISGVYRTEFAIDGNDVSHGTTAQRVLALRDDYTQLSQELRLSATPARGRLVDWQLGLYAHLGWIDFLTGDADGRARQGPRYTRNEVAQNERVLSAFAAATWRLSEHLELATALRWTDTRKRYDGRLTRIDEGSVDAADAARFAAQVASERTAAPAPYAEYAATTVSRFDGERDRRARVLPSLDLSFRPHDTLLAFYRLSTADKAGGFNFRLTNLDPDTLTYAPERVIAHEFGVKARLWEESLFLQAVVFHSTYRDLQQNSSLDGDGNFSAAVVRNAAEAHSRGLELLAEWRPSGAWTVDLAATHLDARYRDYTAADCTRLQSVVADTDVAPAFGVLPATDSRGRVICTQDLSGARLPFAPRHAVRAGLSWTGTVARRWRLQAQAMTFYTSAYFTSPHADALRAQRGFVKHNARVSLGPAGGPWQLALIANNLTDTLTTSQLGQDGNAAASGLLDRPREVFVQLSLRY